MAGPLRGGGEVRAWPLKRTFFETVGKVVVFLASLLQYLARKALLDTKKKYLFSGFPKEAVPLRLLLYLFPLVRPDYAILGISIQEVNIGILIDLAAPALIYRETVTQDFRQEVGWNWTWSLNDVVACFTMRNSHSQRIITKIMIFGILLHIWNYILKPWKTII